jgi:cytochrome c peroxidase
MASGIKHRLLLIAGALLACYGFTCDNPFFNIGEKDVVLEIPAAFPKPVYDFSANKLSPGIFTLGRKLFYDNLLSKDNSISCGSCHQRIAAFAHIDHRLSHGIYAKIGKRNVPALQNLIWKDAYMWDGGVNNLEIQPLNPLTNPAEMDETPGNVIAKLESDGTYKQLFCKAFGDSEVTTQRILKSLAQFTGLMISANSRYDQFCAGTDTFSQAEKKGLSIFRNRCAGCHAEPLFTDNTYRNNGMMPDTSLNDEGRGAITGNEEDRYKFKVPGLRNIAMTYPYMHDGRFRNLNEVLDHYSNSGKFHEKSDKSLIRNTPLLKEEKDELILFLNTLTDKKFLYDRRFADPSMY